MHRNVALILAAALALPALAEAPKAEAVLSVGDRAPGFFLQAVNGKKLGVRRIVLEDWFRDAQSKAVVISFFATWCGPCKKELPLLERMWQRYGEQGLKVVVVSIDREPEAVATLEAFIDELGLTYPVVSDRFNLLARRYLGTTTALPSLFITDGAGKILTFHQSYGDDAEAFLEAEIRRALGLEPSGVQKVSAP